MSNRVIPVICGPTAVGKTSTAVSVFGPEKFCAISADSMQVYNSMDIGTAKPDREELIILPHALINIRNPDQKYSAGDFFNDFNKIIEKYPDKKYVVVGGTGLYLKTLLEGFADLPPADDEIRSRLNSLSNNQLYKMLEKIDLTATNKINSNDRVRLIRAIEVFQLSGRSIFAIRENNRKPGYEFLVAGLIRDRNVIKKRIAQRVDLMMKNGFLQEVSGLLEAGYNINHYSMQGLGYARLVEHLQDKIDLSAAVEQIKRETVKFAHRQIKLFKQLPGIVWFHPDDLNAIKHFFREATG